MKEITQKILANGTTELKAFQRLSRPTLSQKNAWFFTQRKTEGVLNHFCFFKKNT